MGRGTAARAAKYLERYGGFAGPSSVASEQFPTHPTIELFLNEQWVDITPYVYYRDMITIRRGKDDEASQLDPSTCLFTVNNRDGRFSPRNPTGAYYGFLGRNTPVRVSVVRNGTRRYRFYGEVSSWPSKWDISGSDVYVPVESAGVLRRLRQGSSPLRSATYREFIAPNRSDIVAYWPCEDAAGSKSVASGLGGTAMGVTGTPTFASFTNWVGSDALPTMGTGTFLGSVPTYTASGETAVHLLVGAPSGGIAANKVLATATVTGTAASWRLTLQTNGLMVLNIYDGSGVLLQTSGTVGTINGLLVQVTIQMVQNGADIDWVVQFWDLTLTDSITDSLSGGTASGTLAANTVGRVTQLTIAPDAGLGDASVGHVAVATDLTQVLGDTLNAIIGWRDEKPRDRIVRLCKEEGIGLQVSASELLANNETTMGAQLMNTLSDLLAECAASDFGVLSEPTDQVGIGYRTRLTRYNQDPTLTLDYAQNQLSASLDPTDDDRFTRNDVTVIRSDGSSARSIEETGALSVQSPPDGVGRYAESVTSSLGTDDQVGSQASWRLHLGTVDEARFPQISLNLRHSTFTGSVDLMNAALVIDLGDRLDISNPPAWMPPDGIKLGVEGYTEVLGVLEHDITFNTSPYSPYQVAFADASDFARADTDGSTLTSDISSSATSVSVTTQVGSQVWVDSATYASDFPFDIMVAGETMTVTAISGTTSPQTFTVTRSVNGVVKSQTAGTTVNILDPAVVAL